MTITSITSTHHTTKKAFALSGVVSSTELFFHYYVALHTDLNFYVKNIDGGGDVVNLRVLGFHKPHNFDVSAQVLPTDVVVTEELGTTAVADAAFSAIIAIANSTGYTHVAIGLDRAAAADITNVEIYGWGRLRVS